MKGELFRIAHLGFLDYLDTVAVIGALEIVLQQLGVKNFALGDGLAAAQRVYQARWHKAEGAGA
jgi:aspartate aminotransferase-like enzyme